MSQTSTPTVVQKILIGIFVNVSDIYRSSSLPSMLSHSYQVTAPSKASFVPEGIFFPQEHIESKCYQPLQLGRRFLCYLLMAWPHSALGKGEAFSKRRFYQVDNAILSIPISSRIGLPALMGFSRRCKNASFAREESRCRNMIRVNSQVDAQAAQLRKHGSEKSHK